MTNQNSSHTIGYLRVSTDTQDLDKNRADILTLANKENLGRVRFVEEKVSGKVPWRKRKIAAVLGLAGPKLHIWAFGGTNSVHFMPPTAPNTLPRFRLAS